MILMGVARLPSIVDALMREGYPTYLPMAIVERASSPDQRCVASTVEGIVNALERSGEQRPPGMIVVGWAVLALEGSGNLDVLDDALEMEVEETEGITNDKMLEGRDQERVRKWLSRGVGDVIVRDGLSPEWAQLL